MKKIFCLLTFCVFTFTILHGTTDIAMPTHIVAGTVKDINGSPIVGAIVIAIGFNSPHSVLNVTVTDIEGKFSMGVPPETFFFLQYSAVGYIQTMSSTAFSLFGTNCLLTCDITLQEDLTE